MNNTKEKKCKAVLPEAKNEAYYTQRLAHRIIAKFTGSGTVLASNDTIYYQATEDQEVKIQSLIDTCSEELEELIDHVVYSLLRRKNLIPASDIELVLQKIA